MPDSQPNSSLSFTPSVPLNHAPSFSVGSGIVISDLGQFENGNAIAVQADGKILVAGVRGGGLNSYYFLSRYQSNGSLDTSFGAGGSVVTKMFAVAADRTSLFVNRDGSIVFGGDSLIRVDSTGKLDTSFSLTKSAVNVSYSISQQSDGKFIVSGFRPNPDPNAVPYDFNSVIERHNADGSLDLSFNKTGWIDLNLGINDFVEETATQADGKIVALIFSNNLANVVRLNPNGTLDASFGTNGKVVLNSHSWASSSPTSLLILQDGKLLIGGSMGGGYVTRLNTDGSDDLSFNQTGFIEFFASLQADTITPTAFAQQSDGKIIVAGSSGFMYGGTFVAMRLNLDGSIDTSFNKTGKLYLNGSDISPASDIAIQTDGSILFSASKDGDLVMIRVNENGSLDRSLSEINTVNATATFLGGGPAVVLDNSVKVYDYELDGQSFNHARLTIERVGGPHVQDVFSGSGSLVLANGEVRLDSIVIGTYQQLNGRLDIRFGALANEDLVDSTLSQLAYKNSNSHLTKDISIVWTFDDGSGASNAVVMGVSTVKTSAIANRNIPTSADSSVVGIEDTPYQFKLSDFVFHDVDTTDTLQSVMVTGLPTAGVLIREESIGDLPGGHIVQIGDVIDINDIVTGKLQYRAVPNANGDQLVSFNVRVSDGADFSRPATMSISLTPVNDLPTGSVTMRGQFTSGQTIQVSNSLADVDGLGAISYQWKIDGVAVNSATKSSITLTDADVGKSLSVVATYVDGGGTREEVSSLLSLPIGGNFFGTLKDDLFTSTSRDETFNGLLGNDAVAYSGKLANYSIKYRGSHYEVVTKSGYDGLDSLVSIETLKFSDFTVNLGIQSKAAGSKPSDISNLVELYIAFFNRIPEADGLSYWIGELQRGQKLTQIAESFFEAGTSFSGLTGYSKNMSDTDFINTIYRNTLGRSAGADLEGLNYWKAELASGKATRGSLVGTILASAHSFKGDATWGFVADLLDNKKMVGMKLAVDWGIGYTTNEQAIAMGMTIAALVTPQSAEQALAVIGVNSLDMQLY